MITASIFGNKIGVLSDGANGIEFEYYPEFENLNLPISPFKLNIKDKRYYNKYDHMATNGMPGIFLDSMPDGYGAKLMRRYFQEKYGTNKITALQKLAYVGDDGIGAIEYSPSEEYDKVFDIDLSQVSKQIKQDINGNVSDVLERLFKHPSPGGARPKVSVLWNREEGYMQGGHTKYADENLEPWIIKFDEDGKDTTKIEKLYHDVAREIGVRVSETELINLDNEVHYAIKRFDRDNGMKKHQATISGLMHKDYLEPNLISYKDYLVMTHHLTGSMQEVKEAYARMVLNVIGKNCDDHLKNFSFLMDNRSEWSVSPIYDFVYANGDSYHGEHRMNVNGKVKDINKQDILSVAESLGLDERWANERVEQTQDVFSKYLDVAFEYGISKENIEDIKGNVLLNI